MENVPGGDRELKHLGDTEYGGERCGGKENSGGSCADACRVVPGDAAAGDGGLKSSCRVSGEKSCSCSGDGESLVHSSESAVVRYSHVSVDGVRGSHVCDVRSESDSLVSESET